MLRRESHFQHSVEHDFCFISERTIRLLLLKQIVQSPSYPGAMPGIAVFSQEAQRPRGASRPTSIQSLLVEKLL